MKNNRIIGPKFFWIYHPQTPTFELQIYYPKNLQSKSLIKLEERGADHQTEDLRMARALIMDYSIFIRKISSSKDF